MEIPPAVGAPARRALAGAGWTRLDQLTAVTERELRALHGVGPKAIGVLRAALRDRGLSLAGEETGT
ncbi:DNA-binding protein [Micromonospora purpureochromogenes]